MTNKIINSWKIINRLKCRIIYEKEEYLTIKSEVSFYLFISSSICNHSTVINVIKGIVYDYFEGVEKKGKLSRS